jgi:hypothetical protein
MGGGSHAYRIQMVPLMQNWSLADVEIRKAAGSFYVANAGGAVQALAIYTGETLFFV